MSLILVNILSFINAYRTYFILGGIALIFILVLLFSRGCGKPAKLDEKAIQEAQTAIAERNDEKLKEILAEADVKEKVIEGSVNNAKMETINATAEAKKKYANMNASELQAEFENRK